METTVTRQQALALLRKYNREPFHLQHALTVEGVMHWYARQLGFGMEEDFLGGLAGLLHDVDFEAYPEEHCKKAPELFGGDSMRRIRSFTPCAAMAMVWCAMWSPRMRWKNVLFAADELTASSALR